MATVDDDTAARLDALTSRVADLERRLSGGAVGPAESLSPASVDGITGSASLDARFWALQGLRERAPEGGAVLFTGSVTLPTGEEYAWQETYAAAELLDRDWDRAAAALSALAHPVRLRLLRHVLHGARTATELQAEGLGTSGQFYHHVRQLIAAGWLRATGRGQYGVPPERVVIVLAVIAEVDR
ncbi:MAG TPA: winged helix-turn-helix domain-containing protein [Cryptosporangiaceae bacterium]|nr:winged helix-turn-helix domain-containing protein [Cryptosporangiaceae bacterium]